MGITIASAATICATPRYSLMLDGLDLTGHTLTGWYDATQKEIRVITVK